MNNNLQVFNNENLGLKVRTILNSDNSISINAEDTAIGLGWTTVAKSGNEVVRWNRVNKYLEELGFSQQVGRDDYIPESLFYLLAMKANNENALVFQKWLAIDVIPTIRKTGTYTIQPALETSQVSFKEQVECVGIVADILRVNEASKVLMLSKVYEENNVSSKFLPEYVDSGNRERRSATELLKKFNLGMNTTNFNALLVRNGYLEERTRKSNKTDTVKKFKALTEKGLQFGENMISVFNQKEVQPMYYVDSFLELFKLVV